MLTDQRILSEIWSIAAASAPVAERFERLQGFLDENLGMTRMTLWQIDSVAPQLRQLLGALPPERDSRRELTCSASELRALRDWLARAAVHVAARTSTWPRPLTILNHGTAPAIAIVRLHDDQLKPTGFASLMLTKSQHQEQARRVLAALEAPFKHLARSELQRAELETLRAASEAERDSLLHRLGRESLDNVIVGDDGGLRLVLQRVDQVARAAASVLLLGETGSGKEVIARAVHERSARSLAPFLRVNCGALPPDLIDSELFGHEKGSFTGAGQQRRGWFERADRGTLFLDEIGELPAPAQVRLLRVLQEGVLFRVGGEEAVRVDVRIIAATHRDLAHMVSQGTFREDLWYRIAVFPILIPALRDRKQDIPALARHFAQRASLKLGLPLRLPHDTDLELLTGYRWPGNVRELSTVIERAALLGEGNRLAVATALGFGTVTAFESRASGRLATLDEAIAQHIKCALDAAGGRIEGSGGAAELLALNPNTLRSKMRKLRIRRKG